MGDYDKEDLLTFEMDDSPQAEMSAKTLMSKKLQSQSSMVEQLKENGISWRSNLKILNRQVDALI